MKTLYLDIFSGIAGDMFIGAALDLGVDPAALEAELKKLGLDFHLHWSRASRGGVSGVKFDVHADDHHHDEAHEHHAAGDHHHDAPGHHHHEHEPAQDHDDHAPGHSHPHTQPQDEHHHHDHRHPGETDDHGDKPLNHQLSTIHQQPAHGRSFSQIRSLIEQSALSPWVKSRSIAVFERIARAEGKVHGIPARDVHFHEVGAIDSIVDVVGACVALELLGRPRVRAGAIVEGTGWVDCAHGRYPLPVMATLEILRERGVPVTQCDEPHELVTPTGAALLAEFVESFGPLEDFVAEKIGYGLGTRENRRRPNVLRAVLGEEGRGGEGRYDWESDRVVVLETNLDDHQPETLGYLVDKALQEGALDVFYTPAQMKKNRPGVLLGLLCAEGDADRLTELIFHETTALGVRRSVTERKKLRREFVVVPTEFGDVRVKIGKLNGRTLQIAPEFESCRAIAAATGQPLKNLYRAAQQAAAKL